MHFGEAGGARWSNGGVLVWMSAGAVARVIQRRWTERIRTRQG